jgi:5-oxoprolinase (ATP-hydrolysing) subunit A
MQIDLNADLGEGVADDAELMPLITSASICCGFHAGDPETIATALELADQNSVRVGAHPGYADPVNFGRIEHDIDEGEVLRLGVYQVGALKALADMLDVPVLFLKPHGALYHQANEAERYATGFLAVAAHFGELPVLGLPKTILQRRAIEANIPYISEGFADRRYRPDGSLVPRSEANAVIADPREALEQVEWLIGKHNVHTLCVHGDTPGALEFVRAIRGYLEDRGHELKAFT